MFALLKMQFFCLLNMLIFINCFWYDIWYIILFQFFDINLVTVT